MVVTIISISFLLQYHGRTFVAGSCIRLPRRRARAAPSLRFLRTWTATRIEADVPLLRELGVVADEPMVVPAIEEVAESVVKAEEQMAALVIDIEEDLAALFGEDDDFKDDDSESFDEDHRASMRLEVHPLRLPKDHLFPHSASGLPVPPSVIEDLSTRLGNLEYEHGQLVQKVIASQMSHDADR
ncbi:hypothetical protein Tco_0995252 [Tanacetum coccineum]